MQAFVTINKDRAREPRLSELECSMFEVLTRIIQIVVDIVGKYVNLRAHPSAPLRMFELYISLRDVVQEGKDMIRDFRSYPLQIDSLKSKLNMQSEKLQKFGSLLFNVSYELEIFDPQGLRDIETALGFKYYALFKYFYIITYVEGGSLVVNKTTKLPAIAREFEKRFDLRPDDLKQMAFIDSQTFDLTDRIQVE